MDLIALPGAQGYIFDMDGTLVDNMSLHAQAWIETLAAHGARIDLATFYREGAGLNSENTVRHFVDAHAPHDVIEALSSAKEARFRALFTGDARPVAGAAAFLCAARAGGIKTALATSAERAGLVRTMAAVALDGLLDASVGGDEVARGKPAPDIFLAAARRLGLQPAQCVAFEDAPTGIAAAHAAGMPVVALATTIEPGALAGLPGVVMAIRDYRGVRPG